MKKITKFFGVVTVGQRGQVVIPKEARRFFGIKAGDKLIVLSPPLHKRKLDFIPVDDFAKFISEFEKDISAIKEKIGKEKLGKKK